MTSPTLIITPWRRWGEHRSVHSPTSFLTQSSVAEWIRGFWGFILAATVGAFGYQIYTLVDKFQAYPINTNLKVSLSLVSLTSFLSLDVE